MQQRETWLLKSWFCNWKCSATGELWNLQTSPVRQKPIMVYRIPKSRRDILVHAKLNPDPSDDGLIGDSKPCGDKRCFTCKLMTPTKNAISSSGASVNLKKQTNCKTANIIYLITCTQCDKQYVGETKRALNERMNGHCSDWTKRRF